MSDAYAAILVNPTTWIVFAVNVGVSSTDPNQFMPDYYVVINDPIKFDMADIVAGTTTYDLATETFINPPPPPLYTPESALQAIRNIEAGIMMRRGSREIEKSIIEERAQKQADDELAADPTTARTKEDILVANVWYQKMKTAEDQIAVIRPYLNDPNDDY